MKLNPDCVRDILLTIEENTDFSTFWEFGIDNISPEYLSGYTYEEIVYHISQCKKSGLIDGCKFYDAGDSGIVADLSPAGHQFLANIRSDTIWSDVKEVSKKVGSNSLSTLTQIASAVISAIVRAQLGL